MLLEEYAGGMLGGGTLKAWTPGGSSTPLLTAEHLDVGLDFESIAAAGSLLGTGACMVHGRERLHRRGRPAAGGVLRARVLREVHAVPRGHVVGRARARPDRGRATDATEDMPLLSEVGANILFRAFCALADGAVSPIYSTLQYFLDEYEAHVELGRCPLSAGRPVRPSEVARVVSATAGDAHDRRQGGHRARRAR